jgi:hypothetical protein
MREGQELIEDRTRPWRTSCVWSVRPMQHKCTQSAEIAVGILWLSFEAGHVALIERPDAGVGCVRCSRSVCPFICFRLQRLGVFGHGYLKDLAGHGLALLAPWHS